MNIRIKHIFRITITLAIVIGSSYIALRNINLDILISTLLNAHYEWVVLSIPVMLVSHWLRALRWKTMLSPVVEKPSILNMFSAVMIGYAVNNVIPKGGELMRPIIYARRDKVPLSTVMASMIVERFFLMQSWSCCLLQVYSSFKGQISRKLSHGFHGGKCYP